MDEIIDSIMRLDRESNAKAAREIAWQARRATWRGLMGASRDVLRVYYRGAKQAGEGYVYANGYPLAHAWHTISDRIGGWGYANEIHR